MSHLASKTRSLPFRFDLPQLAAWGLVLLFIVTFTRLAILRHASFNSSGFDLGIYDQVVWNTLHGRMFFYTSTGQPLLHLSNHADPILALVAPFYLIHSGPETLLFLQAAAIGLGGLPLFWLAREKLESAIGGLSLMLAYLLFPSLEVVALWDFHPPALAVGFLMAAFYFLVRGKAGWFLLFAVLAMACKENIPLVVAAMGVYAILAHRDWRLGVLTIVLSLSYFIAVMYWIIPAHSVTGQHLFLGFYSDLGDSPLEIVGTALMRPDLVLKNLWQPLKLAYLRDILVPFAFLPLVGLPVFLIGLPMLAINLLSSNPAMYDASGGQYAADVAPWLAWGALYGAFTLRQGLGRLRPGAQPWLSTTIACSLVVVSIVWHLFHGYSPLALNPPRWEISDHDRLAERFLAQIPPDAPISAQGKLYPHLSDRMIAYQFPDVHDAEYVFLDVTRDSWPIHPNDLKTRVQDLLGSSEYGVLDAAHGYILLRRGLANRELPAAFYDFARVATVPATEGSVPALPSVAGPRTGAPGRGGIGKGSAPPQYPLNVEFGDDLRLLGFDLVDDPQRVELDNLRRQQVAVRLYWQARRPIERDVRLYPFFLDPRGEVIEDTQQRPLIAQLWYPPSQWQPGEIVVTQTLPWGLGERWSLAVGVLAGSDWADWNQRLKARVIEASGSPRRFEAATWVRLASFERQAARLVEIMPAEQALQPSHPLQANLDNKMVLLGYDSSLRDGPHGRELAIELYWQALAPMDRDYTVFVHVLRADGERVAQHDAEPWWKVYLPTSTWQPGEQVQDQHLLELPRDLPPGAYRLQVGVYYWETAERLPVMEHNVAVNNYVELGSILLE